jgi:hypothetical protein
VTNAHFRRYSAGQLRARLESSGFRVEQIGYMFAGLIPPKLVMRWLEMAGVEFGNASVEAGRRSFLLVLAYRWFRMEAALAVRFARNVAIWVICGGCGQAIATQLTATLLGSLSVWRVEK